jgi:hypothetical protein
MTGKNIFKLLGTDKELVKLLSGIVFSGVALVSLVITAGVWYF